MTLIAVSSPASEKNTEFLQVRDALDAAGIRVPGCIASDLSNGYLLLEDLGDQTLLPLLSLDTAEAYYQQAVTMLVGIAAIEKELLPLLPYSPAYLQRELDLFVDWFCQRLLGLSVDESCTVVFEALSRVLIDSATAQPQVVVHRDFHSRNLMVLADETLACIDFQDAVRGPVTYDPVSLFKDCYIAWPRVYQLGWLERYRKNLLQTGVITGATAEDFIEWFDLMGLQRHLKVLGIFARLDARDGKSGYLEDLPLVLHYVQEVLALYARRAPEINAFHDWFMATVMPSVVDQPWFKTMPPDAPPP
ncbi:aminoglycoside phosphotransferase [Luminiphilus syltensis NOR5-1B]|uniref:Aminoglycoside phosphotransferase n=1 Tax=Luminiphilus syltensis NOR5-1B TaxID=565045 RepID=B8KVY8_9GAMM|nr:aminoglycoside phosphotransferase [Luminiphilus syltensis NOR5-1B]